MTIEEEYQEYLKKMDRIGITEMSFQGFKETRIAATAQINQTIMHDKRLRPSDVMVIVTITSDLATRNANRAIN